MNPFVGCRLLNWSTPGHLLKSLYRVYGVLLGQKLILLLNKAVVQLGILQFTDWTEHCSMLVVGSYRALTRACICKSLKILKQDYIESIPRAEICSFLIQIPIKKSALK